MLTKLTLTVDKAVIEKAKKFARKRNKSVSRIVGEYLKNITDAKAAVSMKVPMDSPLTDSLVGMFPDGGKDYRTMLEEALAEKYE